MDLGSRKSLDDHHAAATFGTERKWARFLGRGGFWLSLRWWCWVECLEAERQQSGAAPVGEEAKVANADKAFGKDMQEEAAQELIEG